MLNSSMHVERRMLLTDETLYTAALRALVRRAHSVHEMHVYLERRTDDAASAKRVLSRLRQEKLIDDGRYALEFARARVNVRRQGCHRIARELRQRGVPDQHIEEAVAQVFAETDEAVLVRKVIERRLRSARATDERRTRKSPEGEHQKKLDEGLDTFAAKAAARKLADKKLASLYRALLRAGFDAAVIRREVSNATRDAAVAMPELPAGDFPDDAI
jgi:SOS response regulatory protein OraA/RecX